MTRVCLLDWPVLVSSEPGMGKTAAFKHLCAESNYAYFEANQHCNSYIGLFKSVLRAYGLYLCSHYKYELGRQCRRDIIEWGEERPKLLVVDEYQTFSPTVLRELLSIQEATNLPLVLSGNNQRLASTKKDRVAAAQIYNRLGCVIRVPAPSADDCQSVGVEYNVEGKDAYAALIHYGARTSLRDLFRLLDHAKASRSCGGSVRKEHLELAVMLLHGGCEKSNREARKLLAPVDEAPASDQDRTNGASTQLVRRA